MSDLIDRWKAIETICKASCEDMSETTRKQCALNDACEVIEMFKDVPAVELKTGKWIDEQQDRWIYAKCSECLTVHDVKTNYCPNCGARMEGKDE